MELEELYLLARDALDRSIAAAELRGYYRGEGDRIKKANEARANAHDAITALAAFAGKAIANG